VKESLKSERAPLLVKMEMGQLATKQLQQEEEVVLPPPPPVEMDVTIPKSVLRKRNRKPTASTRKTYVSETTSAEWDGDSLVIRNSIGLGRTIRLSPVGVKNLANYEKTVFNNFNHNSKFFALLEKNMDGENNKVDYCHMLVEDHTVSLVQTEIDFLPPKPFQFHQLPWHIIQNINLYHLAFRKLLAFITKKDAVKKKKTPTTSTTNVGKKRQRKKKEDVPLATKLDMQIAAIINGESYDITTDCERLPPSPNPDERQEPPPRRVRCRGTPTPNNDDSDDSDEDSDALPSMPQLE
jgi:hypothetical protein